MSHRLNASVIHPRDAREQLQRTIELVGQGVRSGSVYLPIRQHAARVAARARPKDYLGQLAALYDDFVHRWRYVRDPWLAELVHVDGPAIWSSVYGAAGGVGTGDCDCACAGLASAAASCGFPVRLTTSIPLSRRGGPRAKMPGHIYPEVFVKGPLSDPRVNRWIPADPVVWPQHGLGYAAPALARQRWDLWGRRIAGDELAGEGDDMLGEVYDSNQDYDLVRHGYAGLASDGEPDRWDSVGPKEFGAYADTMGIMGGFGIGIEVEPDEYGLARTPMIELRPEDFAYIRASGVPYHGMCAIGDDGTVYQYDGLHGFFGKLFKGAKKLVKGVVKGVVKAVKSLGGAVWKATKKILKKLPGGKFIIKFTEKIHKTAMKLVRPLAKIAGKLAKKIAPIAAIVPGYGPVISAALYAGGTAASEMAKYGVKQGKKGFLHMPHDKAKVEAFQASMKQRAEEMRKEVHERAKRGESTKQIIFGKRKPLAPGHLPAGTREHAIALRALGVKRTPVNA